MNSISHGSVEIQTCSVSLPSIPDWFAEVSLVAQYLRHLGVLSEICEHVRLARGRMGTYEVIDFVAVLIGYAISAERTLQAFYDRLLPFATPFMALFDRKLLPHRSTLSRFLAAFDQSSLQALRTLFQQDLFARALPLGADAGLWDRQGEHWYVFDIDGTRAAARQRALPQGPDRPAPSRRLTEVCAKGYGGRKRGEVIRTRTVLQEACSYRYFATFSGAGNGDAGGDLRRSLGVLKSYLEQHQLPGSRVLVRLDGLYGNGVVVWDVDQTGVGWLMRGKDYGLLKTPVVQAHLAGPADGEHTHEESGITRQLFDCPQVVLGGAARSRVIVAVRAGSATKSPVGATREGKVYELFYTSLPQGAFVPSDVLELYFGRGGFEGSLADEDQEQDADRWCSHTPFGQECWQILSQWVWNLRIELSQHEHPTPLRSTQLADVQGQEATAAKAQTQEAASPTSESTSEQALGEPLAAEAEQERQWARAGRSGLFAGEDFTEQGDGTLRCPAGQTLWQRERRQGADGRVRIYYAPRANSCRACDLRTRCLRQQGDAPAPRRVSVVVGKPKRPDSPTPKPPPAPPPPPSPAGPHALVWRDWGRSAGRRRWMRWHRSQSVTISQVPESVSARGAPAAGPPLELTREQRAHRRFSWAQRLSRNASLEERPQVRIHLFGIAPALAKLLGVSC